MASTVKVQNAASLERRAVETLRELLAAFPITEERSAKQATWDLTLLVGSGKTARRISLAWPKS